MSTGFALNGTSKRAQRANAAQLNAVLVISIVALLVAPNSLTKAILGSNRWKVVVHKCAVHLVARIARNIVITALIYQVQEVAARGDRCRVQIGRLFTEIADVMKEVSGRAKLLMEMVYVFVVRTIEYKTTSVLRVK